MGVPFNLSPEAWQQAYRRVVGRAVKLTGDKKQALELTQRAIHAALDPEARPWNPEKKTLAHHLCDCVWSFFGNDITSYRVQHASYQLPDESKDIGVGIDAPDPLDEEVPEAAIAYAHNPLTLLLAAHEAARAKRLRDALDVHIKLKKDKDVRFLLDAIDLPEEPFPRDDKGNVIRPPNAEAATTRHAHAAGYTDLEIKNARERLKRYAILVMLDDRKTHPQ